MNHSIKALMDEVLKDEIDYPSLKNKIDAYKASLLDVSQLDIESQSNKTDLHFKNGIAISTSYAALCVDDIIRTRQFIRGLYYAVQKTRENKSGAVRVLYAGTGPFATLALPLMSHFKPDALQFIFLEVNTSTIEYLNLVINELDIREYVDAIICADATTFNLTDVLPVDILISETMQHALVKEMQVPIMLNLVKQLPKETILIPKNISLELSYLRTDAQMILNEKPHLRYRKIQTIMDFNSQFIEDYNNEKGIGDDIIPLCQNVDFREENTEQYDKLAINTSINIFENEWILPDQSGLTIPKIILNLENAHSDKSKISLYYNFQSEPIFEYVLSE